MLKRIKKNSSAEMFKIDSYYYFLCLFLILSCFLIKLLR